MIYSSIASVLLSLPLFAMALDRPSRPQALVYRGASACEGCPEAVAHLLETSSYHFDVAFCGPDEAVDISPEALSAAAVYAYPGGPDLDDAWEDIREHATTIRNYVQNGGRYIGFCLGAYLAGHSPGLGLLPKGIDTNSECEQKGAQVTSTSDSVIQVNWLFKAGTHNKELQRNRWLYFQEGAAVQGFAESDPSVIARYSSNGDVAASATPFGNGFVGLSGPHPEATAEWYRVEGLENPEGVKFDIGHDFINTVMSGVNGNHSLGKASCGGEDTI